MEIFKRWYFWTLVVFGFFSLNFTYVIHKTSRPNQYAMHVEFPDRDAYGDVVSDEESEGESRAPASAHMGASESGVDRLENSAFKKPSSRRHKNQKSVPWGKIVLPSDKKR